MLNILTGLPLDKNKDSAICKNFADSVGTKIILGSSTMKMYCSKLNIKPNIKIIISTNLPTTKYIIEGVDIASEGVITLNECYKLLLNKTSTNKDAIEIIKLIQKEKSINFVIGMADNKQHQFYKENNLLPRIEIINKIIDLLKDKEIKTTFV